MTSSDAVLYVRKRLPRGVKVGHGGTLDPEATGVLPICVGKATRLFDYIVDKRKEYICQLQLGAETDTQDATGSVIKSCTCADLPDAESVTAVLPNFVGEVTQIPPQYSAIKVDGQRLYRTARQGQAVQVPSRVVSVYAAQHLLDMGRGAHMLRFECGKGTYIRTLCHDIGQMLGCGGHMALLLRSKAGLFEIEGAHTLEQVDEAYRENTMESLLLPLDEPIAHLPKIEVGKEQWSRCLNGNNLFIAQEQGEEYEDEPALRIYCNGKFAGIGEITKKTEVSFRCMLLEERS